MPILSKTEWAFRFAVAFLELRDGGIELAALAQWGEELYLKAGHLDPEQVARDLFQVDQG